MYTSYTGDGGAVFPGRSKWKLITFAVYARQTAAAATARTHYAEERRWGCDRDGRCPRAGTSFTDGPTTTAVVECVAYTRLHKRVLKDGAFVKFPGPYTHKRVPRTYNTPRVCAYSVITHRVCVYVHKLMCKCVCVCVCFLSAAVSLFAGLGGREKKRYDDRDEKSSNVAVVSARACI